MSAEVRVRVADMSCGHCAAAIRKAIEAAIPGATANADAETKEVRVGGTGDERAVRAAVEAAGYTPSTAG